MSWNQKVAQNVLLGPTSSEAGVHLSRSPSAGSWWVLYCLVAFQKQPTAALSSLHILGKSSTFEMEKARGTFENNGWFFIHIYYGKFQLSLPTLQVTNLAVTWWVCRCSIVSLQKWSGVTWQYDTSAFQIKMALSIIIWVISLLPLQQDRIQLLLQFWLSN